MSSKALRREIGEDLFEADTLHEDDNLQSATKAVPACSNFFSILADDRGEPINDVLDQPSDASPPLLQSSEDYKKFNSNCSVKKKSRKKKKSAKGQFTLELLLDQDAGAPKETPLPKTCTSCMHIQVPHLNVEKEITNLFGSNVIAQVDHVQDSRHASRLAPGRAHLQKQPFIFVRPLSTWPLIDPYDGLSMKFIETKDNVHYFVMDWNETYKRIQEQFCFLDFEFFFRTYNQHPYHIDTLLRLHNYVLTTDSYEVAQDMLKRLIYRFEKSWHKKFLNEFPLGTCRLEYGPHIQNRSIMLGLANYTYQIYKKGYTKTTLEFCKFLFTLDPSDPFGLLYWIDQCILRKNRHSLITEFLAHPMLCKKNVLIRPNWLYSLALAKFHLEKNKTRSSDLSGDIYVPSYQPQFLSDSSHVLAQAILTFPQALIYLCSRLSVQPLPDNGIDTHPYFISAQDTDDSYDPVHLQCLLYAEWANRNWKTPSTLQWLVDTTHRIVRAIEQPDFNTDEWLERQRSIRQLTNTNFHDLQGLYRHALLSDHPDINKYLPPSVLEQGIQIYSEEDINTLFPSSTRYEEPPPPDSPSSSSLSTLLEYLLPL